MLGHGQSPAALLTQTNDQTSDAPNLEMTVKTVGGEYCVGDNDLDILLLKLRLTFTNKGKEPLILFKGSSLIDTIKISRNVADALAQRYEADISQTQLTAGAKQCYRGAVPNKCFVILAPRGSYEVDTKVRILVVRGDVRKIGGAVMSGDHALQVNVSTWHETDKLAKNLRARWRRSGTLWSQPLTSAPIRFSVSKQHQLLKECP
jgi:hypothetical protein